MAVQRIGPDVRMTPIAPPDTVARTPGSKSLTNRYLACAALADGPSTLRGASLSDDALAMIDGLRSLGVRAQIDEPAGGIEVAGRGGLLPNDEASIDIGMAGTAMRFLTALVTLGHGRYRLDGAARMRRRPIRDLVDALRQLGAAIEYEADEGFPPLVVHASGLPGGEAVLDAPPSSQFISAILMAAPYAHGDVMVRIDGELVSEPYVGLTLDVMRTMGVELVDHEDRRFIVPAPQRYAGGVYDVEPDASGATYLWAAAAITGGRVGVRGLSRTSRQGDVAFVDVLARMGCTVEQRDGALFVCGPANGRLSGVQIDLNRMPDTVQTLAVAALFADGPTRIDNVANLRIKETDRIEALARELTKLGASVETRPDGLTITPPRVVRGARIHTYDDHRMAMSFAVAGLRAEGVEIADAGCVSKSFPEYFDVLDALGHAGQGRTPGGRTTR